MADNAVPRSKEVLGLLKPLSPGQTTPNNPTFVYANPKPSPTTVIDYKSNLRKKKSQTDEMSKVDGEEAPVATAAGGQDLNVDEEKAKVDAAAQAVKENNSPAVSKEVESFHAAVDDLIDTLQSKFEKASAEMYGRMDDMTERLDSLEASIIASHEANQHHSG